MVEDCAPDIVQVVEGDALTLDYAALLGSASAAAAPLEPYDRPPVSLPHSLPKEADGHANADPLASPDASVGGTSDRRPAVHIVGNLPFSIASPLLMRFLRMADQRSGLFQHGPAAMTLCFQKEVAQRMAAPPDTKLRSRLSVMTQHYCEVERRFVLPGHVFVPPPNVDAEVIHLRGRAHLEQPAMPLHGPCFFDLLEETAKLVFHHRRKVLHHAARNLVAASRAPGPSPARVPWNANRGSGIEGVESEGMEEDDVASDTSARRRPQAPRVRASSLASAEEAQAFVALCGLPEDARPFKLSTTDVVRIATLFGALKAASGDMSALRPLALP
jgi:16S rRNA A1518/A1519 N6-dimethyltransferase RsmA/KsgA/DIM1 with predicted DNA glycosylase/AP lyase activity